MRQRPLCFVFLFLIVIILVSKMSGVSLWGEPDRELREYVSSIEGQNRVVYGTVGAREEKTNSISYFLRDSYILNGVSFKDADPVRIEEYEPTYIRNLQIYISKEEPQIAVGSEVIFFGTPYLYENASNPGGFDAALYYAADGCCAYMYAEAQRVVRESAFSLEEAFASLRERLVENLNDLMRPESAAVLSAMLFGERSHLTEDIKLGYSAAGISHLIAISGLHVMIIGKAIYRLLAICRLKPVAASLASVCVVYVYCAFAGGGESTLRASIMFSVAYIGRVLLRSYDPLSALSFSGIIMLLASPMSLFRVGFQLSFAAATSIAILSPYIKKILVRKSSEEATNPLQKLKANVADSAAVWLSVNVATFPLILYHFSEFPTYSLMANIVFVPLMGIVMTAGAIGAILSLFAAPVAGVVLLVPDMILRLQNAAGAAILKLPYSTLILGKPDEWRLLPALLGVVLLVVILKRHTDAKKRAGCRGRAVFAASVLAAAFLIASPAVRTHEGFSITVLDVGQGDCIFIQNGGRLFMVDGGSSSSDGVGTYDIIPYIRALGISVIEAVFVTHDDADHMNGVEELFAAIRDDKTEISVGRLFLPYWLYGTDEGDALESLAGEAGTPTYYIQKGDSISDGELRIEVLSPAYGDGFTGNEGSLVLSVTYGAFDALLTGDIEGEAEDILSDGIGEYELLKVSHHGSKNSTTEEFLRAVSPDVCVISAPKHSIYGHPHEDTMERIESVGADAYQTGLCGAVTVKVSEGRMEVTCER